MLKTIPFRNLNFTVNSIGTTSAANTATMLNYIDIPVMFGKKILNVINVMDYHQMVLCL